VWALFASGCIGWPFQAARIKAADDHSRGGAQAGK
jgi:hypothetical protein